MGQSRRCFLQTLGMGVAVVSLPELSSILNSIAFPGAHGAVDFSIEKLLFGHEADGAFLAHAETYAIEGNPQQLLKAPSAFLKTLNQLGHNSSFSSRVNYADADQCKPDFESREDAWTPKFNEFTSVKRAPADRDSAIMVAGNVTPDRTITEAEGATQYQDNPAVTLSGNDPGVMWAAGKLLGEHYNLSQRELAQGLTVIKRTTEQANGQVATVYQTPASSIVHLPDPQRNNGFGQRSRGIVLAHNKNDRSKPKNIYLAGLFA